MAGTFATTDYMQRLYPSATIREPQPPEWQHCAVVGKSG
jgi:hypothetical protein